MSKTITIMTIRPTALHGQHITAGCTLTLPAIDAHALVANGKAMLRNDDDADALQAAVRAADHQIARSSPGYMPSIVGRLGIASSTAP